MTDQMEIIFTTEMNEHNWTCCAWDPRSGTQLCTYKGGGSIPSHALALIDRKFLIAANQTKPLLHIWPINSSEQMQGVRLVIPGRATSLATSPDGCFCVAAVAESIYIWQICSGRLVSKLSGHYQQVTTIRFTDDGSHFLSAGQDGLVLVWRLSTVIAPSNSSSSNKQRSANTVYSFSDHALPVSDVVIGKGGMRAYMASVSLDATCKLYDLSSGRLLVTVIFPEALTAVTLDHLDKNVYVGTNNGQIYAYSLQSPPRTKDYCYQAADNVKSRFSSHRGAITALSISLYGDTLISGSSDHTVILWHIPSRQVIRILTHKSTISNAFYSLAPKILFSEDKSLNLIIKNFERMMMHDKGNKENDDVVEILVTDKLYEDADTIDVADVSDDYRRSLFVASSHTDHKTYGKDKQRSNDQDGKSELESLRLEVEKLKSINRELFETTLKHVLGSFSGDDRNICNA